MGFRGRPLHRRSVRAGALVLVALLLSGCFGGTAPTCPSCAQPTDTPASPPPRNVTAPPPDFTDAGYLMDEPWHVGDGWDYLSNDSQMHTVRVLKELRGPNATRLLLIEETDRQAGSPTPRTREDSWIDGDTLARYNATFVGGSLTFNLTPSDPQLRFLKNGTFAYNETSTTPRGSTLTVVRANSYYVGPERVRLPWATVSAGRVEHRILRAVQGGDTQRLLIVHDAFRDYGADVRYQVGDGSLYTLNAVQYNGITHGALIDVG
jgi:hypothetical protein